MEDKKKKSPLRERGRKAIVKLADPNGTIAQEIYRKNVELARTNHTLSLLRTIDGLVLETENTLSDLATGITQALVDNSNYSFSALFMRTSLHSDLPMKLGGFGVVPTSKDKLPIDGTLSSVELLFSQKWVHDKDSPKIISIGGNETAAFKELFKDDGKIIHKLMLDLTVQTVCLVKLVARKNLVGVLMVGVGVKPSELSTDEIEYLGRIGEASGLAIDNKLLFEENQQVLKKLRQSNEKLKALDEAKDEFISMASHQLRTPLTSVKGYVSMVLDGDAGKVGAQQKQLLEQAFTSSQRMVYLIADLLNVSRLKTGKFIIEPIPVNLPDVVEGEMQQLTQSAKVHNLVLSYEKPASFPLMNLDETKTRQVIMNFMDNAIYYTPAGGHIKVELTATDKTVDFKVIDDGLGVPKAEQPHLFTKFFRAGNAKKARPDGTGLGLFMAKKVIVAQGGALLFQSEEGKGSTFGFSFPRNALEVKK